jgi:hypothetical protein
MLIGELLRTIMVEPLELPVTSLQANPNLFLCQRQSLILIQSRCLSLSENSRLHLACRRLPRLAVERRWAEVAQRRAGCLAVLLRQHAGLLLA